MKKIKILDCTLRDGGYINNWEFGANNISKIIKGLQLAKIDLIEAGFISNTIFNPNSTIYSSFENLPNNYNLCAMITYGKFEDKNIPEVENSNIKTLRINFKKENFNEAIELCKKIRDKGYDIFVNPSFINTYTLLEIENLINKINEINPKAASIVDSMGCLDIANTTKIYDLFDNNLKSDIAICYHSHNNLNLSFKNAMNLINNKSKRNLIIDSTLFGMGRGAGNLNTELIANQFKNKYDSNILNILIKEYIEPLYIKSPWGWNETYNLCAKMQCHPNYGKYFLNKKINKDLVEAFLKSLNDKDKYIFNQEILKTIIQLSQR